MREAPARHAASAAGSPPSAMRRVLHLALLAGILWFGRLAFLAAVRSANVGADVRAIGVEATALYRAFEQFHERNREYPADYHGARFDLATLDPLRRRGYYRGSIGTKLLGGTVDAFGSPDDRGVNQEFWVEMTLASDPSIRFVVAKSDDAPSSGGEWLDGVYVYRHGKLERL